jgi:hypothetical protein
LHAIDGKIGGGRSGYNTPHNDDDIDGDDDDYDDDDDDYKTLM